MFNQRRSSRQGRFNPLYDYYRRPLVDKKLLDLPSTARGPWTTKGMEERFRTSYVKVPLDLDVHLDYTRLPHEDMLALHNEAKKKNRFVLYINLGDSPHAYDQTPAERKELYELGEYATTVSPLTPFVVLHNFYECLTTFPPNPSLRGLFVRLQNLIAENGLENVQTAAGRLGRIVDNLNAAAEVFAAYLITGCVTFTASPEVVLKIEQTLRAMLFILKDYPGLYVVQQLTGGDGWYEQYEMDRRSP